MLSKKRKKLSTEESPGVKAHEDIDLLCCISFSKKELCFSPEYVKDLDDMIRKLEIIENDVKNISVIKEIIMDWQADKLSDRRALVLILEILAKPAYTHYQQEKEKEREK